MLVYHSVAHGLWYSPTVILAIMVVGSLRCLLDIQLRPVKELLENKLKKEENERKDTDFFFSAVV